MSRGLVVLCTPESLGDKMIFGFRGSITCREIQFLLGKANVQGRARSTASLGQKCTTAVVGGVFLSG